MCPLSSIVYAWIRASHSCIFVYPYTCIVGGPHVIYTYCLYRCMTWPSYFKYRTFIHVRKPLFKYQTRPFIIIISDSRIDSICHSVNTSPLYRQFADPSNLCKFVFTAYKIVLGNLVCFLFWLTFLILYLLDIWTFCIYYIINLLGLIIVSRIQLL